MHVHLVAPSNEDSTYIKPLWPINLMMHELAERKIAGGDRAWRKHRSMELPFGL